MSTGYCKVCDGPLKSEINRRLKAGQGRAKISEWAASRDFPISLPTLSKHRAHITDPKTTLVEQAQRNPAIKRVTTSEFLQALVDIGAARAERSPDDITIAESLKAAQILESKKDKQVDVLLVIARAMTGNLPTPTEPPLIEGEWKEASE